MPLQQGLRIYGFILMVLPEVAKTDIWADKLFNTEIDIFPSKAETSFTASDLRYKLDS